MKVFRELIIHGDAPSLEKLITHSTDSLSDGWSRNRDEEKRIRSLGADTVLLCFECDERSERPAASLWLAVEKSTARVSNIVPQNVTQLTRDEYNNILQQFHARLLNAARDLGLSIEFTPAEQTLENWASKEAASRLRFFSDHANKSTWAAHPNDRDRWYKFLVLAHREKSALDSSSLRRWLEEEAGWSPDAAMELAMEYSRARSLLEFYDQSS